MTNSEKLTILYTLKGIQPYTPMKGYVALLLSPFDKLSDTQDRRRMPGNIKVMGMGKNGPIPPGEMHQMQEQIQEMMEGITGMRRRKDNDEDRDIIIIEPEADYQKRNWNYGVLIEATFVKVEEKEEAKQDQ